MASNSSFISATVSDVQALLDHVEAAQAIAAARAQEWVSHTAEGYTFADGDFAGREEQFTRAQFLDVQTSLNNMASILGGNATVLYRLKE